MLPVQTNLHDGDTYYCCSYKCVVSTAPISHQIINPFASQPPALPTSIMDHTLDDVRDKLERVLSEMLEHRAQVLDKVYLEMMISHLSGQTGGGPDYAPLLKTAFLHDWLQRSFGLLAAADAGGEANAADGGGGGSGGRPPNAQLYAFTLRVLALMIADEWQFLKIVDADVLNQ